MSVSARQLVDSGSCDSGEGRQVAYHYGVDPRSLPGCRCRCPSWRSEGRYSATWRGCLKPRGWSRGGLWSSMSSRRECVGIGRAARWTAPPGRPPAGRDLGRVTRCKSGGAAFGAHCCSVLHPTFCLTSTDSANRASTTKHQRRHVRTTDRKSQCWSVQHHSLCLEMDSDADGCVDGIHVDMEHLKKGEVKYVRHRLFTSISAMMSNRANASCLALVPRCRIPSTQLLSLRCSDDELEALQMRSTADILQHGRELQGWSYSWFVLLGLAAPTYTDRFIRRRLTDNNWIVHCESCYRQAYPSPRYHLVLQVRGTALDGMSPLD